MNLMESFEKTLADVCAELDMALQHNFNIALENWESNCESNGYSLLSYASENWDDFIDQLKYLIDSLFSNGLEDTDPRIKAVEKNRRPRNQKGQLINMGRTENSKVVRINFNDFYLVVRSLLEPEKEEFGKEISMATADFLKSVLPFEIKKDERDFEQYQYEKLVLTQIQDDNKLNSYLE